jgi:hypothetical protein
MTGLMLKLSKSDYYNKLTKEWVSVLYERNGKYMIRDQDGVCKFISKEDVQTYDEYITQFFKHADNKI